MPFMYSLSRTAMIGALSLLASLTAKAQDSRFQLVEWPDSEGRFNERFDEYGRVSGDIIMGVMIGAAATDESTPRRADAAPRGSADVDVPALSRPQRVGTDARFCVRLNSKDGRFEAENTYRATGASGGIGGTLDYEGGYGDEVQRLTAVSLIKVGQCGDRTEVVIPSAWAGTMPEEADLALHVFVNSAGNPTFAVPGDDAEPLICQDVVDETTLKYTALCILPLDEVARHASDGLVTFTFHVSRSLGEEQFSISVILPDSGA